MKQKLAKQAIAKNYPILYTYTAFNVILELLYLAQQHNVPSHRTGSYTTQQYIVAGVILVFTLPSLAM